MVTSNESQNNKSVVVKSSKEAKFEALVSCIREVSWFHKFRATPEKVFETSMVDKRFNIYMCEENQAYISEA